MTGASGLVGTRFVDMFANKYEIFNLDLTNNVDITSYDSVINYLDAHQAGTLIHLAAFTDTDKAFQESGDKNGLCYQVNVVGTENIVKACQTKNIHLIHISTDYVFDGTKSTPYVEDDPRNPLEWYGQTKMEAEDVVSQSGASFTIVRISYPYRGNFDLKPDLIKKIRLGLKSGDLSPRFTDTIITPTFIDDIARGFDKLVASKKEGIYHFVGSTPLSPYELARKVAAAYGFDPNIVKAGSLSEYLKNVSRPFARHVALSNQKATRELGLTFATIDQGLTEIKKQQNL